MSHEPDDIKRWTARRKAAAVMDIIKGKTTASRGFSVEVVERLNDEPTQDLVLRFIDEKFERIAAAV